MVEDLEDPYSLLREQFTELVMFIGTLESKNMTKWNTVKSLRMLMIMLITNQYMMV